ncbi:MAG: hypothetical protein K0B09_04615, partial [Bacteroidales bacterium]|nr:hypothetical protein [Bacteroidales bacterium]
HLQELYQNEGVKFKKHFSNLKEEMVLIRLQKFFYLEPVGEGMYLDQAQPKVAYFEIPDYLAWDDFKGITTKAKYETDLLFFDAATAYFYQNKKIVNLVRIYKEDISITKLRPIKERFLKLIDEK